MIWVRARGFTIVELLIVIVIIGVLASITVVAYNGIQQRANNTSRISAAKEWYQILHTYLAQNGQYPVGSSNVHFCLGTGWPTNLDGNADEDCYMQTNVKHPSVTFNSALQAVSSSLPSFPKDKLTAVSSPQVLGISMRSHDSLIDQSTGTTTTFYRMLHYWLQGNNQDCVLRPVAQLVSGGWAVTTNTFSSNDGAQTRCVILLPDPLGI